MVSSSLRPRWAKKNSPLPFFSSSSLAIFLICCSFLLLIFLFSSSFPFLGSGHGSRASVCSTLPKNLCRYDQGHWVQDSTRKPIYADECPFQRNAWNCLRNRRPSMDKIFSWKWVPYDCELPGINPHQFLTAMRNRSIGFVGDSLNENFLVSFLCILRSADPGAKKWKRKGAWRGAYFPKFNVIVAYHRAVLLAKYRLQSESLEGYTLQPGAKGIYRVDIDVPADDWINITNFYDIFIFNTGHWWNTDKFPKETPLLFYKEGRMISPTLTIMDGLKLVLQSMSSFIEINIPNDKLKIWRLQSPRHFYGGDWNQNGSCTFEKLLDQSELDAWFDPKNGGVNREAREINSVIRHALHGTGIYQLDLTHLSEYRIDAHPATWLGRSDAVSIWGQDCMHWCLPGLPDTWVDVLAAIIMEHMDSKDKCNLYANAM